VLELLDILLARLASGETAALATLVRSRGSTPQKAGAAMLVLASGQTHGTLGGGCTEAEARRQSLALLHAAPASASGCPGSPGQGHPPATLLSFKLNHDFGWDDGLICGGIMDVAIEVFSTTSDLSRIQHLRDALAARQSATYEIRASGPQTRNSQLTTRNSPLSFPLPFHPTPHLIIAGAGHVAQSLSHIAHAAGFSQTVIDDRAEFASADRFPHATVVVAPTDIGLARASIDTHTYVVIVTRGHKNDARSLGAIIGSRAKYIGLIGSRRKIRTILADLEARGTPRAQLAAVHAPIGLNLGAITPEEIAVSICAELIAVRRGTTDTTSMKMPEEDLATYLDRADLP
jgi:xanthine dehydrogenase accessory factor